MARWAFRIGTVLFGVLALSACHQNGTVFTVDTTLDAVDANPGDGLCADAEGACTLRAAVMEANALPGVEEIRFSVPGPVSISMAGKYEDGALVGDLDILEAVVITGPAIIDGDGTGRVFDVHHTSGLVELDQLEVRNGNETLGVGVRVRSDGHILITNSEFHHHEADTTVLDLGGSGHAWILNSTFWANEGLGGVISNRTKTMTLSNVSVVENETLGPSVWTQGGDLIIYSTIAENGFGLTGEATVTASIIANNPSGDCALGAAIESGGGNIESATDCGFTEATDLQNTDPLLLPMVLPGFPVQQTVPTKLIAASSPARDHVAVGPGGECVIPTDAVGALRPTGTGCDAGAFEVTPGPGCADPTNGGAYLCDLPKIDLSGEVLNFSNFSGTNFEGANFAGTESMISHFTGTNLSGAALTNGNFNGTAFDRIVADDADFTGSLLRGTSWGTTDLKNANFSNADLSGAFLDEAHVSAVTWSNTICPSGVNSDANGGNCDGQL